MLLSNSTPEFINTLAGCMLASALSTLWKQRRQRKGNTNIGKYDEIGKSLVELVCKSDSTFTGILLFIEIPYSTVFYNILWDTSFFLFVCNCKALGEAAMVTLWFGYDLFIDKQSQIIFFFKI